MFGFYCSPLLQQAAHVIAVDVSAAPTNSVREQHLQHAQEHGSHENVQMNLGVLLLCSTQTTPERNSWLRSC